MAENKVFSYTKRDYESIRKEGIAKLPTLSKGQWTDFNATDPGIVLLDYVHALVDMVQYYQDHQALESFLPTAKERKNIFRLAYQLGYEISSAKGAEVDCIMVMKYLYDSSIFIPKHSVVLSNNDNTMYITASDVLIPPNTQEISIPCVQGTIEEVRYDGTGMTKYREDVEFPEDQKVHLARPNIDTDTIEVRDDVGNIWTRINRLVFSTGNERVYQVRLNYDNTVDILFGDDERGYAPKETDTLRISYMYSLGEEGRVGASVLSGFQDTIQDMNGTAIEYLLYNPNAATGGSGPQSDESITQLAPGVIKAQNRAVTLEDFVNLAKNVPGVSDAKAYDINTAPDLEGMSLYEVRVLVVPTDNMEAPGPLLRRVREYLEARMIPPTNLHVSSPATIPVDIDITVRQSSTHESYETDIREAITKYFNNRKGEVGVDFNPYDLISVVSRIEGVRSIESITPSQPVSISKLSVATLGNLTVTTL